MHESAPNFLPALPFPIYKIFNPVTNNKNYTHRKHQSPHSKPIIKNVLDKIVEGRLRRKMLYSVKSTCALGAAGFANR